MNLVIDQGNTRFKTALFNGNKLIKWAVFNKNETKGFHNWVNTHTNDSINLIVSSVVDEVINVDELKVKRAIYLGENTKLPISNNYTTPQTLGKDRLANACGAWSIASNENSLVIDLGTCIKYDIVDNNGVYLGGNISPGMQMRYKSLHQLTDKLPLLDFELLSQPFGDDTNTSIRCGVQLGIVNEIKGFIDRYSSLYKGLTIFMTGGDAIYFDKSFKNHIFAVSNLTLIGLNEILLHNE